MERRSYTLDHGSHSSIQTSKIFFLSIRFKKIILYYRPNWFILLQTVYDYDTFSKDDNMGDAELDVSPFIEALKMNINDPPSGTIITRIQPCRTNCLAEESCISYTDGQIVQDVVLRLRNVECGEVEIQLQWIALPGAKGL